MLGIFKENGVSQKKESKAVNACISSFLAPGINPMKVALDTDALYHHQGAEKRCLGLFLSACGLFFF